MKEKRNFIFRPATLLKLVWMVCLVALSGPSFSLSLGSVTGQSYTLKKQRVPDAAPVYIVGAHSSHHHPTVPGSSPAEEIPGKGESEEDTDEEFSRLCASGFTHLYELGPTAQRLSKRLRLSVKSRSSVSLIVLHHSWKSFLI
jgi:hypothetical protein